MGRAVELILNRFANVIKRRKHKCPACDFFVESYRSLLEACPDLVKQFDQSGADISMLYTCETLNVDQYMCPRCRSTDRDRLIGLFIRTEMASRRRRGRRNEILELAPSAPLRRVIDQVASEHRTADLYREDVDDRMDVTKMTGYPDDRFDMVLCSHVLEHVRDDLKALKEIHRVVKPGGFAIILVPIFLNLDKTDEDSSVTDPGERVRRFAQSDHVRAYAKEGFVQRLLDAGFFIEEWDVTRRGRRQFMKSGIHERSVLYVCHKQ